MALGTVTNNLCINNCNPHSLTARFHTISNTFDLFFCFLSTPGTPTPKLEWVKDAVPLATLNNTRYKLTAAGMSLQVRKVQPEDSGIFQCFARNAAGEVEAHTHLIVTSE